MTNAEALDRIMQRLAGRTSEVTRAAVLTELNLKIDELEGGEWKPWFLEKRTTGVLVVDQDYLDLPSDFVEEYEEGAFVLLDPDTAAASYPKKVDIEWLESECLIGANNAVPSGYALFGDQFILGPKPDKAYSYRLKYLGRTDDVVDNTDPITNKWLLEFFNYITLETAMQVALTILQSQEMATKMKPERDKAKDHFWRRVVSRQMANTDPLLGNTED